MEDKNDTVSKAAWEYEMKENNRLRAQVEALKAEVASLKGQVTAYQFCAMAPYISDTLVKGALE